jgi:signal transduction histidine kinase
LKLEEVAHAPILPGRVQGTFRAPASERGQRWIFLGQAVAGLGGGRQLILFASPRLGIGGWFAENLLPPLVRAGAVALVLSVLLALLVSRSVAAPLRRVTSAAEAIARGESGTRAPVSGPAEVQALARSFNAMADQVQATQQSQRDFVANVSHELKTPLTSIQGFSQALLDGTASTPEAAARAARVVHEEAARMRRMVDELLILARFDAGEMVMARGPVELAPLLRGCAEKLTPQAQAAHVALELDVPEPLIVAGDADRLAQVFANLLDNGVAHTPAGGQVAVAARRVDQERAVEVTVTDTGPGIPAEALPRIFERFYQVDKARRRSRGAGLGLAIIKEIVEAHGGTVTVESVVGLGSKFTVRLPVSVKSQPFPTINRPTP